MNQSHYQELFTQLPVAIWVEDFSAVKKRLDELREICGNNPLDYFRDHPEVVRECAGLVKIVEVNDKVLEIYGASSRNDLLTRLDQVFTDESFENFAENLARVLSGETQICTHAPNRTLDGRIIQVELRIILPDAYLHTWGKIFVVTLDVTRQFQAEQALKLSEERFRLLYRNAPLPYQSLDAAGRFIDVNPAFEEMLGYRREELIGTRITKLLTAESQKLLRERFCTFLDDGSVKDLEFTMRRKDGTLIDVMVKGRIGYDLEGRFKQTHCLLTNITEQKKAQTELKRREYSYRRLYDQFRILFDGIPDVLLLLTSDSRLTWANVSASKACGIPVEAMIGKTCRQLFEEHSAPCDVEMTERCISEGEIGTSLVTTPDGRSWGVRAFPIRSEDGKVIQIMELAHDVTDKIKLQAETMRTGHLAALGELAAGVAHEINNPINGIINYAQILINQGKKEGRQNEIAERIVKEGDRIATIVGNLLSFSRDRVEEKRPVVLNDLLQEALSLCATRLRKDGINLELDIPANLPCLLGKHQKLEQVFINLISNAQHALNQRFPAPCPDKKLIISARPLTDKGMLEIVFHDHGCGIPEEVRDRILNPFFSTKPQGEGTGLGLSISHGIIQDHGGAIYFDSLPGAFTRVILTLPIAG